jgi:DNA-binding CsgD family transcriptional regulator
MIEPGSAPAHYQTLKSRAFTSQMAPHVALPLAQSLLWNGHVHDAVEVIDCVSAGLGSEQTAPPAPDTLAEVMATDLQIATSFPGVHRRVAAGPAHPDQIRLASAPAAAKVRVHLLLQNVLSGHGDALTAAQAEQSLHNSNLLDRSVSACVVPAVLALIYAGLLDPVQNAVTRLLEDATTTDLPGWAAVLHGLLGLIAMRRGELDVAVDHSSAALTPATQRPMDTHASLALATLAEAHTAIGNHDEAAAYFTFPIPPALFQTRSGLHYQYARGRHHLAAGRRYAALADFTACGEQMQQWSLDTANLAPWRIGAAEAWLALGQQQKAAALLEEQLAVRGLGAARTHGMALRTLAATREQCDRVGVLDRSARLLQASGDRYQLALSLADLSRAYRGVGDKDKARSAALRARRMAKVCHADTLCEALMATGPVEASWSAARERSIDRLSKSEQRVAALAARGLTNREIAEELFVTVSTVEQHLTRVYKKMDVRSREDLPAKLRAEAAA